MKPRYLFRAFKARYRDQRAEIGVALASIRPGDLAVDAGANKGAYLYWLRAAAGPAGTIFGFEPQARLAEYLRRVRDMMHWNNVRIREAALSDSAGTRVLHVPGGGISPGASLEAAVLETGSGDRVKCETLTLDDELREAGRLAFLKVDVEGHELAVFRGGQATIGRDRPVVVFECERRHLSRHRVEDVLAFWKGLDYEGAFFDRASLRPLEDFDVDLHQRADGDRFWDAPDYFNNFCFAPSPKMAELKRRFASTAR